jgi:hypothetical protein
MRAVRRRHALRRGPRRPLRGGAVLASLLTPTSSTTCKWLSRPSNVVVRLQFSRTTAGGGTCCWCHMRTPQGPAPMAKGRATAFLLAGAHSCASLCLPCAPPEPPCWLSHEAGTTRATVHLFLPCTPFRAPVLAFSRGRHLCRRRAFPVTPQKRSRAPRGPLPLGRTPCPPFLMWTNYPVPHSPLGQSPCPTVLPCWRIQHTTTNNRNRRCEGP